MSVVSLLREWLTTAAVKFTMPRLNNADKACTTGERHSKRERSQAEQHNIGWQDSGLRNWAVEKKARYDAERSSRWKRRRRRA
jgi:hypothetical protein